MFSVTLPARAQSPKGPRAHSPLLRSFLAGLTAPVPAVLVPSQRRVRTAFFSRSPAPPTWPRDQPSGITWLRRPPHKPIGAAPLGCDTQSEAARVLSPAHAATKVGSF